MDHHSIVLAFLAIIAAIVIPADGKHHHHHLDSSTRGLVFYIHDIVNASEAGTDASTYLVARPLTAELSSTFGSILVFDDKITAITNFNSTEIGRAQGKITVVNLSGSSPVLFYEFAAVFPDGKLCFFGHRPLADKTSELTVFACGGKFRRGMALARLSAVYFSPSGLNEIIRVEVPPRQQGAEQAAGWSQFSISDKI